MERQLFLVQYNPSMQGVLDQGMAWDCENNGDFGRQNLQLLNRSGDSRAAVCGGQGRENSRITMIT